MPTLGNHLDFAKLEARNVAVHNLTAPPSSPVAGQMYFDTTPGDLTLYWYDGSSWIPAKDIGGGGAPTGAAGGDLSGTYPNPTIGVGKVTSSHIADGTITDTDVAAANKDGGGGTASMRTLGYSSVKAMAGNASLNNISGNNPTTGAINFGGFQGVNSAAPTATSDLATKGYVDGVAQGLDAKASVRRASTSNIVIASATTTYALDGGNVAPGDRILVKDQSAPAENGIYVVGSPWARATDFDAWAEAPGAYVFVEEGTVNADTGWVCTADQSGTLGTTAIPWVQFSGAGQITSGAGLTKTGNTLDVGAGAGITVNADTVQVANDGITNAMIADGAVNLAGADVTGTLPLTKGGTGGASAAAARGALGTPGFYQNVGPPSGAASWTILQSAHGLGSSRGIMVQVATEPGGAVIIPDVSINASGDVTIAWAASVASNSHRAVLVG